MIGSWRLAISSGVKSVFKSSLCQGRKFNPKTGSTTPVFRNITTSSSGDTNLSATSFIVSSYFRSVNCSVTDSRAKSLHNHSNFVNHRHTQTNTHRAESLTAMQPRIELTWPTNDSSINLGSFGTSTRRRHVVGTNDRNSIKLCGLKYVLLHFLPSLASLTYIPKSNPKPEEIAWNKCRKSSAVGLPVGRLRNKPRRGSKVELPLSQ